MSVLEELHPDLAALLDQGICYHHAGLENDVGEMIRKLCATGAIAISYATTTFSRGVNLSVPLVVLQGIDRYNGTGQREKYTAREIAQQLARATAKGTTRAAGGGEGLILTSSDDASRNRCQEAMQGPFELKSVLDKIWAQVLLLLSELVRVGGKQERMSLTSLLAKESFLSSTTAYDPDYVQQVLEHMEQVEVVVTRGKD